MTIDVRDIKNEKVDLQEKSLSFSGVSDGKRYETKLDLYKEVSPEVSY